MARLLAKNESFRSCNSMTVLPKLTINVLAAVFGAAWRD
jgi:hypothetical protein